MSTKNLYYRSAFRRENVIKSFVLDVFKKLWSYPRLIIEVFIRCQFGRRYFRLSAALSTLILLIVIPILLHRVETISEDYSGESNFWGHYATWYSYVIAYLYFAFKRWLEIQHSPSTYDLTKFTLYSGNINPLFFRFNLFGRPTPRLVETVYEPTLFFTAGLILAVIGQPLGFLLIICSVIYSMSYLAAYKEGDDFLMDLIDEKLMNDEFRSAFVDDLLGEHTRGVRYYMTKPTTAANRSKLESSVIDNNDENATFAYAE
ncbi:MAG: hypothetical protein QM726_01010 [Chitinophagaceae bacterium]